MKKNRSVGTHDGSFHADEVTACALLIVFNLVDQDLIVRSREPSILNDCEYICDVGGIYDPKSKLFDHHQIDYKGHLSSAGMILKYLVDEGKISLQEYRHLNESVIAGVDAHDNGVEQPMPGVCTYSQLISNFTPINYEASAVEQYKAFQEAVTFAISHLRRLLERFRYIHSLKDEVQEAMSHGKEYLYFQKSIPWMDCFFELNGERHPALFVVMPSGSHWKVRGIPPNSHEKMKVRFPLPNEWAGLMDQDLKNISGIPGAIFCHKGRFFSLWETKEDALKALDFILSKTKGKK